MTRKLLSVLLIVTLAITLVGCSGGNTQDSKSEETTGEADEGLKVAMVTDVGGVNDQSFTPISLGRFTESFRRSRCKCFLSRIPSRRRLYSKLRDFN